MIQWGSTPIGECDAEFLCYGLGNHILLCCIYCGRNSIVSYKNHIVALCQKHKITLYETALDEYGCVSSRKARRVIVLPIANYRAYILALHECYHLLGKKERTILNEELRVWGLVLKYSRFPSREINSIVADCLLSYESWADKRFHRSLAWKRAIVKAKMILR